jgi:CRISPR-associated protein Cmr3
MTIWFIEPRDPLIVRDGLPFNPDPGAQATSLSFPFPSTTTGGVRTRAGLDDDGIFDKSKTELVKTIKVRGPLLVQLTKDGNDIEPDKWLVPAPIDALLLGDKEKARCKQLVPLQVVNGSQTDFDQHNTDGLALVGMAKAEQSKSAKDVPPYWYWDKFQSWLINPSSLFSKGVLDPSSLGYNGPQREHRIHVSIDPEKSVAKEGALFGTSGMEFTYTGTGKEKRIDDFRQLALAVAVEENGEFSLREGLTGFGGERRIVRWRKSDSDLPLCPEELAEAIIKNRACRVHLLTPACFTQGYRPKWLIDRESECKSTLKSIATQRPQVVSGWDLEHRKPKPTRRLAPAGSVFFLSLDGSERSVRNWIDEMWMQCVSDEEQDRNDGFGLAVLGTWSGKLEQMQ